MQMIKCPGCRADQWDNVNYCSECGKPIAALHHPILSAAHQPDPPPPTVVVVKAGREWRVSGFVAVALGVVLAVAGAATAGACVAGIGFVAFVVGRLME